ncbi:hypothetical protein M422DRAFT_258479 [Sphaerobolus stellatus SS14]|uniref:Uncharacterized protein n=1 Tax=Sphaerobolus stellatus (strain SS14) TaxID=990650 RepID=A0A0C9VBD6_SPHS4|nr:hypothetical protein M422DRAFT_258479 [Sphaerobolus stellatus SS14]
MQSAYAHEHTNERRGEKDEVERRDPVKTCTEEMEHQRKKDAMRPYATKRWEETEHQRKIQRSNKLRRLQPRISEEPTPADDVRRDEHAEGWDVDVNGESSSIAR